MASAEATFCALCEKITPYPDIWSFNPGKYHGIAIISIVQGTIYTADGSSGSTGFLGNLQISLVLSQHLGYLETLGQGQELVDSTDIFEEDIALFLVLQAQDSVKQEIYSGCFDFIIHYSASSLFLTLIHQYFNTPQE